MSHMPFFSSKTGEFLGSYEATEGCCDHRNAESTGETCSVGCCDEYKCPDCGKTFMVQCPD